MPQVFEPVSPVTVEVRGSQVTVDADAMKSWEAFKLLRQMSEGSGFSQVAAAESLLSLVAGLSLDDVAGKCGPNPRTDDVLSYAGELIRAATPKN